MTNKATPEIKHCPYCGSDEIKFVGNVPRCLKCRAVFTATFSRYARKSSANFDKEIDSHIAKARAVADDMRKKIADKVEQLRHE